MIVLYRCFRLVLLVALVSLLLIVFSVLVTPYRTLSLRICALTSRIRHTSSDITCSRNPLVSGSSDVLNKSVNKVAIKNQILGETTSVYVVSLKRRIDRRERMERLRNALGLNWIYFPALDRENIIIDKILAFVIRQRATFNVEFQWPQKLERPILLASSFLNDLSLRTVNVDTATTDDLLCATENNTIPTYANASSVPFHMRLSRGMLACWYSHLQLIVTIVNNTQHIRDVNWDGKDGITIVFEDDVDVEWDLADRLARMWDDLPRDWDIIMLGHCWSDESKHSPLSPHSPLHPSNNPKCTHGYILSPSGSRKLLLYLTYPPFAFSRALDQAIAFLIRSGAIKAYSVVPSIVVQRRSRDESGDSDIWNEGGVKGSKWRDELVDSALDRIESMEIG